MQITIKVFQPHPEFPNPGTPIQEYTLEVEDSKQVEAKYRFAATRSF